MGALGDGDQLDPRLDRRRRMRWLAVARERLRAVFFGARQDEEFEDELRFHLEQETELLRREGLDAHEARREARLRFGGVERVKEEVREARGILLLENLVKDVRYGARMLRKRPGFTAVAVLSLAIGIGANTAIFSLVNAIILQEKPYSHPDELVHVYGTSPAIALGALSYPDFEELRDGTADVFSAIAAANLPLLPLDEGAGVGDVVGEAVTGDYFSLFGIQAHLGRVIGREDDVSPGGHPVVMLSHGYWQRRFGSDRDVVGRELRLGGQAYTIIGVTRAEYRGVTPLLKPELIVPMSMYDELVGWDMRDDRGSHSLFVRARLAPGVALAQADTAVAAVAAALDAGRLEGWDVGDGFNVVPTTDVLVSPSVDPNIRALAWLLMIVVGLVLLLACTNLASFLLARARDRRREVALRLALGASRGALVRQFLTETTLLSLLGGVAGFGLAVGLLRGVERADLPLPFSIRMTLDLSPDATVLAFTCGLSMLAGTLLGIIPAWQGTRADVVTTLKQDSAGGGQLGQVRWRNALVVAQLTLSLVLLVGAGLFLRSAQRLTAVDPGFGREPTALMGVMVPNTRFTADSMRVDCLSGSGRSPALTRSVSSKSCH